MNTSPRRVDLFSDEASRKLGLPTKVERIAPKLAEALRKARKVLKNRGGSTGYECLKEVNAALAEWDQS